MYAMPSTAKISCIPLLLYTCITLPGLAQSFQLSQWPLGSLQGPQTSGNRIGAVASENKICSQIGIDLLKGGGNAVDAVSFFS